MRLLHVHSGNMYGGVETLLITLARHRDLCPTMESHYALCFEGRLSAELTAAGVPVHLLGKTRISQPVTVLRARRALSNLVQRGDFDLAVCHSSWTQSLFGPVARAADLPLLFWLHSQPNGNHWLERWGRRTVPDLMVCNSRFTAATAARMYPGVPSEIVYCPVAPPGRDFSRDDRATKRAELQTPQDAVVIIQVSRMEALKGHLVHLEALSLVKHLPDWICWLVGGAERPGEIRYLEKLKSTAAQLGIADRVRFLEKRSDVPELLAAADIYCQPNTAPDSFGISFIEALYAQLPVVTTEIGGACEIIDETCGVLVPPQDANALAGTLRRLIQDQPLRAKLGTAGPKRARELCHPITQLSRLEEMFASLVQRQVTV